MRNLPGPGIEPMSPELAGEFLATGPPRKPLNFFWFMSQVLSDAYQETDLSILQVTSWNMFLMHQAVDK